jgi:hypothetical protein
MGLVVAALMTACGGAQSTTASSRATSTARPTSTERASTGAQAAAIHQAVATYWKTLNQQCRRGDRFEQRGAYISTSDPQYGYGAVVDNSCGYAFGFFVRRPGTAGEDWRVVGSYQDSAQDCSEFERFLPVRVIVEFSLKGLDGSDTFGVCFTSVPKSEADLLGCSNPNVPFPIRTLQVENITCGSADRAIEHGHYTSTGYTTPGYRCATVPPAGDSTRYRCARGHAVFRFLSGG